MLAGHLALTVAALFAGAAFYVGFAEQPARLQLDDCAPLAEWKPSYRRGFAMQATLAFVGLLLGTIQWWQPGDSLWLAGVLLLASWPFTLIVIMPTNNALLVTPSEAASAGSRELVVKWGRPHAVRTALGAAATLMLLWAVS
jgi:hypothetical protein